MSPKAPSGRLARWALLLQEFNIKKLEYIPGKQNVIADTLSRPNIEDEEIEECRTPYVTVNFSTKGADALQRE